MNDNIAMHHNLITGEIVFRTSDSEQVNAIRVNGILLTENQNIGVHGLGKAQQVLQLNFFKKMDDPTLKVADVIILGMTYLGRMTEEEFKAVPEGYQQQEMAKEEVAPEAPVDLDVLMVEETNK